MIKKIISGGQTGADRAALDFAISNDIPHGGWAPKGRRAEDGTIPDHYNLREAPVPDYSRRTELNVMDADGTLILSHGELTGGSALTAQLAKKHGKPCLHVDLSRRTEFQATVDITHWLREHRVDVLNVAGPRAGNDPKIYDATVNVLEAVWLLGLVGETLPEVMYRPGVEEAREAPPDSVDAAVARLVKELPLKDRSRLAGMGEHDLAHLHPSLNLYIQNTYGLGAENSALMQSCRAAADGAELDPEAAGAVIIRKLWEKLQETHRIRRVK